MDNPSSADKIPVSINITLMKLDCSAVGLDIQDDMGRHEVGFVENTEKTPVGTGCRFEGKFYIHKVGRQSCASLSVPAQYLGFLL